MSQDELERRLSGVYSDALHKLIIDNAKTLKMYKDIDSGKVAPPAYIDTDEKLAAWKRNQLTQLFQKRNLINGIIEQLDKAGMKSTGYILKGLEQQYKAEHDATVKELKQLARDNGMSVEFGMLNAYAVRAAVDDTVQNSAFSKIAFNNLGKNDAVRRQLQSEMGIAIAMGQSQDKIIKRIANVVGVAGYNAKRTAQTESTRIRSQARNTAGQEAADMGIRVYNQWSCQFMPPKVTKTGRQYGGSRDTHKQLDGVCAMQGEAFVLSDGDKLMFPGDPNGKACNVINCHCVLIPGVLMDDEEIVDGKVVKRAKGKNDQQNEEQPNQSEVKRKQEVDAIISSDKAYSVMNDVQKAEYINTLVNMSDENFALYKIISEMSDDNVYDRKGYSAFYSPSKDKVFMDITNTYWHERSGVSSEFNKKTKFHEQLHKLDRHAGDAFGYIGAITKRGNAGQTVVNAIRDDLTAYINAACASRDIKPIKSIDRISTKAKEAFWQQLAIDIPNEKERAKCSTVTDAIGLITSGKLDTYSKGYWGHNHTYQSERGEDGAVSEMFAQYGAFVLAGYDECVQISRKFFPTACKQLDALYTMILEGWY